MQLAQWLMVAMEEWLDACGKPKEPEALQLLERCLQLMGSEEEAHKTFLKLLRATLARQG